MSNIYEKPSADLAINTNKDSEVTQAMIDGVYKAKGWAKFVAILLFIYVGFIGLAVVVSLLGNDPRFSLSSMPAVGMIIMVLFILFLAFIIFRFGKLFLNYNASVKSLAETSSIEDLDDCFSNFAKIHKMMAILMISTICIVILLAFAIPAYSEYVVRAGMMG